MNIKLSFPSKIFKKNISNVNGACRHVWMWRSCGVGLTRQAMAFLTEPSFIHSVIHVTEGARALTCFNLSTSVTNTSPLIQRSCTDLFSLFNIIKKNKEFLFPILHFLFWFGFVRWVCKTVQASLIFFQQSIIRLRLPYLFSISFGFLSFLSLHFSIFSLYFLWFWSAIFLRKQPGIMKVWFSL